ncbi:uncharacterized protein LOC143290763 [Babylonia areolata]|uniref:uncharacterized protein LOC143290763 n=1 Tax=Babylonia areolata TaxID=304850 RepID=UPI003FD1A6AA
MYACINVHVHVKECINVTQVSLTNRKKVAALLPVFLWLGSLMLVGLVGNSLSIYIFGWRLESNVQNFLFVWLAVFDLATCLIGIPSEMADLAMYRLICKPLHSQMELVHARKGVGFAAGIGLVVAVPTLSLYGMRTVQISAEGLNGCDCSVQDTFHVSYLPYLIITISKTVSQNLGYQQEGVRLIFFMIFLRSYFFNSVANFFIYSGMHTEFRSECKQICIWRGIQYTQFEGHMGWTFGEGTVFAFAAV